MAVAVTLTLFILTMYLEDIKALNYPLIVKLTRIDGPSRRSKESMLKLKLQKHEERMKAVVEHMKEYFTSSLYLYTEVQRIKEYGVVMNPARILLAYMDETGPGTIRGKRIREYFFSCYEHIKPRYTRHVWDDLNNNNLVINYLKDPLNDGAS